MANGSVQVTLKGTENVKKALNRLADMGARKRDISAVFRTATKPLIQAGKQEAPIGTVKTYSKRYTSRRHKPGTLRGSIKFFTSKKYKSTWYVTPGPKGWYKHFIGLGTRRGIQPNPFMARAWDKAGGGVISKIEKGLWDLVEKIWRAGR